MMSTYVLCKQFLDSLFSTDKYELSKPISTDSSTLPIIHHKKSTTPYRDALMKNIIKVDFKNKDHLYYKKLGDKINKIVEDRYNQRSHRYWWIEEYLRESYITKNRLLRRKEYCIITKPKISTTGN